MEIYDENYVAKPAYNFHAQRSSFQSRAKLKLFGQAVTTSQNIHS